MHREISHTDEAFARPSYAGVFAFTAVAAVFCALAGSRLIAHAVSNAPEGAHLPTPAVPVTEQH